MDDLLAAVGLLFVIEGLLWALFPGYGVRMLEAVEEMPESSLRLAGAIAVAVGLVVFWWVRG